MIHSSGYRAVLAAVVVLCGVLAAPVRAQTVEYTFSGHVTEILHPTPFSTTFADLEIGAPFHGRMVFEIPSNTNSGLFYESPDAILEAWVDGHHFLWQGAGTDFAFFNDQEIGGDLSTGVPVDGFHLQAWPPYDPVEPKQVYPETFAPDGFGVKFYDASQSLLNNGFPPEFSLDDVNWAYFELEGATYENFPEESAEGFNIRGEITTLTLVPEPASALLMVASAFFALRRRTHAN